MFLKKATIPLIMVFGIGLLAFAQELIPHPFSARFREEMTMWFRIIGGFALKTVGDARFPLVVGVVFIWGILPVVYLANHFWGLTIAGFWLFFAADEIIRAGINLWRWRSGRWKSMGIT